MHYHRYVAIGDSTSEGLDDPDGRGGYRGWANRLAERIAAQQGSLLYANLAIRGRTTRQIREEQLAPALAMRPISRLSSPERMTCCVVTSMRTDSAPISRRCRAR